MNHFKTILKKIVYGIKQPFRLNLKSRWRLSEKKKSDIGGFTSLNIWLTCFLKISAWGPRAWGSASRINQTTSSTDHVVGSLLDGALDSWDSGDALYPPERTERGVFLVWGNDGLMRGQIMCRARSLTCPVAVRKHVGAGGWLPAHTHGAWAAGELLRGAKPVGGLGQVGRAYGGESGIAVVDGVALAFRLVSVIVLSHRCLS